MSQYHASGDYQSPKRNEDDNRKLFIGGLKWETTKEDVQQYFEQFGEVTYANIKTDSNTGKSRGFGFVTFADEASLIKVLQQRHELDGKTIDPKRAKSRYMQDFGPVYKIFVGGLDPNTPEEVIRGYFGQYGQISDFSHPHDKKKGQKKGFCFIKFENPDVVHNIVGNQMSAKHTVGESEVEVKRAEERYPMHNVHGDGWGQGGWGGYQSWGHGGGGRRGGYDRYEHMRGWSGDAGYYSGSNYMSGGGGSSSGSYGGGVGGGSSYGSHSYDNYGSSGNSGYYNQSSGSNYQYGNGSFD